MDQSLRSNMFPISAEGAADFFFFPFPAQLETGKKKQKTSQRAQWQTSSAISSTCVIKVAEDDVMQLNLQCGLEGDEGHCQHVWELH